MIAYAIIGVAIVLVATFVMGYLVGHMKGVTEGAMKAQADEAASDAVAAKEKQQIVDEAEKTKDAIATETPSQLAETIWNGGPSAPKP